MNENNLFFRSCTAIYKYRNLFSNSAFFLGAISGFLVGYLTDGFGLFSGNDFRTLVFEYFFVPVLLLIADAILLAIAGDIYRNRYGKKINRIRDIEPFCTENTSRESLSKLAHIAMLLWMSLLGGYVTSIGYIAMFVVLQD